MINQHEKPWLSDGELLSVCIPTYNRAPYLDELLKEFGNQIEAQPSLSQSLVIYISDNASMDDTPRVVERAQKRIPRLVYTRNSSNIGGDANILHVRTLARGYYTWVLGDDEILHPGSLAALVAFLGDRSAGLVVLFDSDYDPIMKVPACFADYREFTKSCMTYNPHAMVQHTLISSNIYRSDCFDADVARQFADMYYPHMFGMIRPVYQKRLPVVVPDFPVIALRQFDRPYGEGGGHPPVDEAWQTYLGWLRDELQLPDLDPMAPTVTARKMMLQNMIRHPLAFFWRNRHAVTSPSAYRHLFMRLFLVRRKLTG